jgi:gamma-glutamylcyclotransferase (GGCT)/AIG2-like uncharacterized protein YtfP
MSAPANQMLFSYGTLQFREVQLSQFGRILEGHPDTLPGHRLTMIEITDPEVIAASGTDRHPLVAPSGDPGDSVSGSVYTITEAELAAADAYEVDDYARVQVTLGSGSTAWVYLDAAAARTRTPDAPDTPDRPGAI